MPAALALSADPTDESTRGSKFADAMSMLASGVVLVTSRVSGRPWGTTVTAFISVSAEPPTVLISLASATASAHAITTSGRFGVSILGDDQLAVARFGSASGVAKFIEAFVDAADGNGTSPVVAGSLAHLDCELTDAVQVADHTLFLGRVLASRLPGGGTPLLYHRRGYSSLGGRVGGRQRLRAERSSRVSRVDS
jgi:flavin reductase (DIM6/NTAB) family NADH-FMN oxidoreductase RutF